MTEDPGNVCTRTQKHQLNYRQMIEIRGGNNSLGFYTTTVILSLLSTSCSRAVTEDRSGVSLNTSDVSSHLTFDQDQVMRYKKNNFN